MANVGDRLSVGDREGVVVRSVNIAEGVELTVRVPDDDHPLPEGEYPLAYDPHALILDGHGGAVAGTPFDNNSAEDAAAKNDEVRERHLESAKQGEQERLAADRATDVKGDAPATQKPTGNKAPAKAADRKAGDTK